MREWVGDRLRAFDRQAADRRVRDAVGEVPKSVRLLLGLLADGVKLARVGDRRGWSCGPSSRSARYSIRWAGRGRSRRTCSRWPRCTTSSATSA